MLKPRWQDASVAFVVSIAEFALLFEHSDSVGAAGLGLTALACVALLWRGRAPFRRPAGRAGPAGTARGDGRRAPAARRR
jgi:hypothetical protein